MYALGRRWIEHALSMSSEPRSDAMPMLTAGGSVPIRTSAASESAYESWKSADPVAISIQRREGLSHEPQSDLGLCSVVVLVVLAGEAQRTLIIEPLVEKKITHLWARPSRPWRN